jgi:hypothetical protein
MKTYKLKIYCLSLHIIAHTRRRQYCKSFWIKNFQWSRKFHNEYRYSLITTNLVNIKILSGVTKLIKLSILFIGKLIISLPSYVNSESFINGNRPGRKDFSHAILYDAFFFSISHGVCILPIHRTTHVQ